MTFYDKYLKYKNKYSALKRYIDSSKQTVDNINSLNYKNKYFNLRLKYLNIFDGIDFLEENHTSNKNKYLDLKDTNQIGGNKISNIPETAISIITIDGNPKKETELIIIPGFSNSSYDRNYKTLFEYYDTKLDVNKFKKVHLIKFQDNEEFSIRDFHGKLLEEDVYLENKLYKKLAKIISKKLKSNKYTILAKSAGGGVGIYLSKLIRSHLNKLLLFAPGVGYINNDLKKLRLHKNKIIVGWNKEDTKVKMEKIWPVLETLLPNTKVLLFNMDINNHGLGVDTQHEINSKFIENVY